MITHRLHVNRIGVALALLTGTALMTAQTLIAEDSSPQQTEHALDTTIPVRVQYLLTLPKDYDTQEKWPLVLFLHGKGERGNDLELVKKHGPPKLVAAGREFPFILVSPQCPDTQWWESLELLALLDEIEKQYKVDKDRIYVTGLSMGGFGTWSLIHSAPDRFAAAAPICGGGFPFWAKHFKNVPVWAFHGAKDSVVPLEWSQTMVDALNKEGGEGQLTIYPEAGHDAWTETYDDPEFYDWLLSHR